MQALRRRTALPALAVALITRTTPAVQRCLLSTQRNASDDELAAARTWLAALHAESIPLRNIGELSFSRSSGPGGQNVNKVNSKATLKVPLEALLHHVPTAIHAELKRSRYVAVRSNALVVQADDSRKQNDNAHSCYKRLYEAIVEAGKHAVPTETSAEQVQRVKDLQKSDNERRLKSKRQQSAKKSSRRGRGDE
ncbi:hypothetical protein T440DRAFT_395423 [Plenodomus tracheiphilus IPT5]|uniref:Prokaryotic-type class I peptide chain release factors domain-containing protein n=1 Tax=Plenodomus tracheiphilus IPT5 TaxID=1408161 RepID=A0A6A7B7L5_9PLEO|nr:hypothetical protein T440DRAFT_395423 [Plenodomus tracheiphilus IPT5]